MKVFSFLDEVTEVKKNDSLTAFFTLKGDEEFLKDHFADFPVMPGVLLLECVKQAAERLLILSSEHVKNHLYRLVKASTVKFGRFVTPGSRLKLSVRLLTDSNETVHHFEGRIELVENGVAGGKALTADFLLAHRV